MRGGRRCRSVALTSIAALSAAGCGVDTTGPPIAEPSAPTASSRTGTIAEPATTAETTTTTATTTSHVPETATTTTSMTSTWSVTSVPPETSATSAPSVTSSAAGTTTIPWNESTHRLYQQFVAQYPDFPTMTDEEIQEKIKRGEFVIVSPPRPSYDRTCAENAAMYWEDWDWWGRDRPAMTDLRSEVAATLMGDLESLLEALEDGGEPDGSVPQGRSLVWFLARIRCYDGVRMLVDAGADLSARGNLEGPLHMAFHDDRLDIVRLLLEAGVPIDDPESEWGWTVAFWADSREAAELLLEYGADLTHEERGMGDQPLDFVVEAGRVDVVEVYLRAGAPLRPRTLYAIAANYAEPAALVEVAELLLAHPDLPKLTEFPIERFGVLPSEYVAEWGHPEVAEVLRAAGL